MDLVDEQNVARLEIGQERGEIAGFGNDRSRGGAEIDAEFARHDLRQRGLAEARRADEQHVVERFLARARRLDEHREIGARLFLADEFAQSLRPQRGVDVVVALVGGHQAARGCAHVIPRRYLFGSNSPMLVTVGVLPPGTITRALAS